MSELDQALDQRLAKASLNERMLFAAEREQQVTAENARQMQSMVEGLYKQFWESGGLAGLVGLKPVHEQIREAFEAEAAATTPEEKLAALNSNPLANFLGPAVLGKIVFHGTPHRWLPEKGYPKGRPHLGKVGTGEGAQAYGHGFYAAESPGVAGAYQKALSGDNYEFVNYFSKKTGQIINDFGTRLSKAKDAIRATGIRNSDHVNRILSDIEEVLPEIGSPSKYLDVYDVAPQFKKGYEAAIKALDDVQYGHNPGQLYKLDIPDAAIDKMLDWDAPLSADTSKPIKDAMNRITREYPGLKDDYYKAFRDGEPGWYYYSRLQDEIGKTRPASYAGDPLVYNQQKASEAFHKAGIPGVKYYDQMSRGSGKGTRNYVVWDQDVLNQTKILDD